MSTGGPLNVLNGKHGISSRLRTVPVMNLIRKHKPQGRGELVDLIASHSKPENPCECGIKSTGTIEDFGKSLYNAQKNEWGQYIHTLEECITWEYNLFIINSLKGNVIEEKAIQEFRKHFKGWNISESSEKIDNDYRVDLVISDNHNHNKSGIQVKPETYKRMRGSVKLSNEMRNKQWGNPVFYLYYNKESNFINLEDVILSVNKAIRFSTLAISVSLLHTSGFVFFTFFFAIFNSLFVNIQFLY